MTLSIFSRVRFLTGRSQNFYSHAGLKRVRQRSDECVVYRRTPMWSTFIRGAHLPAPVHQPAPVCSRSFVIWLMCVCSRLPLKIADLSCHGTPPTSAHLTGQGRTMQVSRFSSPSPSFSSDLFAPRIVQGTYLILS